MKVPFIGLCGAAAIILHTGAIAPVSGALAAEEGCIKTDVAFHVRRCPAVVIVDSASGASSAVVEPTVTEVVEPTVVPTAGPPEGCIKTEIAFHVRRCPVVVVMP
jgi:hypothetical protein